MRKRYDGIITVQRKSVVETGSGQGDAIWSDIAFRIPAVVNVTRGVERRLVTVEDLAEQEVTFTIRYHAIPEAFRPLTAQDRVLYRSDKLPVNIQKVETHQVYDILSPEEVGREVDWSIKTKRHTD